MESYATNQPENKSLPKMVKVPGYEKLRDRADQFIHDYGFVLDEHGFDVGPPLLMVPLEGECANPWRMSITDVAERELDVTGDLAVELLFELERRVNQLNAAKEAVERRWRRLNGK